METMAATDSVNWGYWIALFFLTGTNAWSVIMYILERKKRQNEVKKEQKEVDYKEFATLKSQLEYQDERLEDYEIKLKDRERIDDELRKELIEMKRSKFDSDMRVLKLERKLAERDAAYEVDACINYDCPNRKHNIKAQ